MTLEADLLRNQHALDRGFTRYEGQKDIILTRQSTGGKLARTGIAYIMIMTCYSYVLNIPLTMTDTLNIGTQYLNGNLHGYAVEANGIKANTDGELLTRNYNWRNLDWIDKNFQANIVGNFNLFNLEHTLISGIELEDYDYKSFIIRSKDHFDLDINHPYKPQTLPELNNITTHDREQLKAKLYLFRIRFI